MNNDVIKKWRVLAMLNNIKNAVQGGKDVFPMIQSYMDFVKNINESEREKGKNELR